ncbi:MAG: DNA primase [Prevotella sp.]|nr:DNA primase [Prevotella sp.]
MIDRQTVEKIKDAADIVEVVSEFVTLRKSGANYKGLCPFHNEKTPSFMVSPARGTCHCFGCGKGGNPVSFIMEHEQMTYPEALRWLANKYHIEIVERELTNEEKEEQSTREAMFIVNEFALQYFMDNLHNHPDGKAIGLQYFRSRGIRDDIIEKFQLGFDLNDRLAFAQTALKKGYNADLIEKVGICYKNDRGELIDRYAGRVIFPWIGVSGKVVGFGGRKLDAGTKGIQQKYVNSPDSEIYHKDRELYGLYQAKRAIAKEDCVYMVEGYTDVIAMHQAGIENVVANSGTALSTHQISILHRFTSNIVLLYDGDAAGIHAALRGTDMLLAEGMKLKVLLFPDGDDPDSFARKHTAGDFRKYIDEHQQDFIAFKTDVLLKDASDPVQRSEAINSVVNSISMVVNPILRATYLQDCSQRMGIPETTLMNQMNRLIRERGGRNRPAEAQQPEQPVAKPQEIPAKMKEKTDEQRVERLLAELVVLYGDVVIFDNVEDENGTPMMLNVAQFVNYNLAADNLSFVNPLYKKILDEAVAHSANPEWKSEPYFINHDDIEISRFAVPLSDIRNLDPAIGGQDKDEVRQRAVHLVLDFRVDILDRRLQEIKAEIGSATADAARLSALMAEFKEKSEMRNALARKIGSNIMV